MKTQSPRKGLLIPSHIPSDLRKANITERELQLDIHLGIETFALYDNLNWNFLKSKPHRQPGYPSAKPGYVPLSFRRVPPTPLLLTIEGGVTPDELVKVWHRAREVPPCWFRNPFEAVQIGWVPWGDL
eukprot:sb/3475365/